MSSQPARTISDYDAFGSLYDRHMGAEFAARVLPVLDRLLLNDLAPGAAVLDVCCGTGRVSAGLLARGFRVTAIDASPSMLALASVNAPAANIVLGDISRIDLPPGFDAAVSTFNSLAHLYTDNDLRGAFAAVHRALARGGRWLFDLTTEQAYRTWWHGSFFMVDEHECGIVRPSYDPVRRMARNEVTVFQRDGTELSHRTDRTIFQKCHSVDEVLRALRNAGFSAVETYDAEAVGMSGEHGRIFFLAQLA